MAASEPLPLPIEIILTCSICQATIPEIYEEHDSDKGFRDRNSADEEEQIVTKFWLTECGHLTCGKHLAGGGVPFHPTGEQPQAACPYCIKETGDHERRALYGVRGWDEGLFDEAIPRNWFSSPPIQLGGEGEAMQAMRFQYLSLIRFGSNALVKLREQRREHTQLDRAVKDSNSQCHELQGHIDRLKEQLVELKSCEAALTVWREREPKILHYLGVFDEVTRENTKLRDQLTAMGYAVPIRKWTKDVPPIDIGKKILTETVSGTKNPPHTAPVPKAKTSHNASTNVKGAGLREEDKPKQLIEPRVPAGISSNKRKRDQEEGLEGALKRPYPALVREDSGKLMPPPLRPDATRLQAQSTRHESKEVPTREDLTARLNISPEDLHMLRRHSMSNEHPAYRNKDHEQGSRTQHSSHHIHDPEVERPPTPPTQPIPKDSRGTYSRSYFNSNNNLSSDIARRYPLPDRTDWRVADNFHPGPTSPYQTGKGSHSASRPKHADEFPRNSITPRYTPNGFQGKQVVRYSPTRGRATLAPHPRQNNPAFQPPSRNAMPTMHTPSLRSKNFNQYSYSSPLQNPSIPPREAVTSPFFSRSPRPREPGPVTFSARSKATSHILTSGEINDEPRTRGAYERRSPAEMISRYSHEHPRPLHSPSTWVPATPRRSFAEVDPTRDINGLFKRPDRPELSYPTRSDSFAPRTAFPNMGQGTPSVRSAHYPNNEDRYPRYREEFTPQHYPRIPLPNLRSNSSWQPRKIPRRHQDLDLNTILEGGVPHGSVIGTSSRR